MIDDCGSTFVWKHECSLAVLVFFVGVIRLVCAALAVDPFMQSGGAIYVWDGSTLTMTLCTLSGNTATGVRTPATWMHDWFE